MDEFHVPTMAGAKKGISKIYMSFEQHKASSKPEIQALPGCCST
jgi:hypothetical protein